MISSSFHICSLSESAILVEFGKKIDEKNNADLLSLATSIETNPFPGFIELVPAYSSLAVFYDVAVIRRHFRSFSSAYKAVQALLTDYITTHAISTATLARQSIKIPVCYSETFGWDWEEVCKHTGLSINEVISLHTSAIYQVYMMGFLPGFAYLGGMSKKIATPRKAQPRLKVLAGCVGIAGEQTGIYPLDSPGGWQIIGKTPITLFNPSLSEPTLLKAGDRVQFYEIDEQTFWDWNT